jgi:RES domain-containing protein
LVYSPDLLDALEQLVPEPWSGVVYRHMFGDNDPALENVRGARWNPRDVPARYVSLEAETAVAEGDHVMEVQPFRPRIARWLYEVKIELKSVVDLTDPATLASVGLGLADIRSDNHAKCRAVGGGVAWLGHDGLLVPSARIEGTNLVIYGANVDPHADYDVISRRSVP